MRPPREVILGWDPSPRRLGWGVVCESSGEPLACGVEALDGSPEATATALREIGAALDWHAWEPTAAWVEDVFSPGRGMLHSSAVALGYLEYGLRARWPWLTVARIVPTAWRARVGVRASGRDALKAEALAVAGALGFAHEGSEDAAEAGLIARAGWVALERGEAERVGRGVA